MASGTAGKTVVLIPARGGSKGLPGKNIRPLAGKPLIQHTIEAALLCPLVDTIYVSTEDAAIRETAEQASALVVDRPKHLATDEASTIDVVRHFLDWHRQTYGSMPETLVLLQPTSPLRTATHVSEALNQYTRLKQPASVVSISLAKPLAWQGSLDEAGQFVFNDVPDLSRNRQTQTTNYVLNGAIYISTPERFLSDELMAPFVFGYAMPQEASVDIDTLADFELAEVLLKQAQNAPSVSSKLAGRADA